MKLAIVGSRHFTDLELILRVAKRLEPCEIISGGARGADSLAEKVASDLGLRFRVFLPEISRYGSPAAYHIRNRQIATYCDKMLACVHVQHKSSGTMSAVRAAEKLGRDVVTIYENSLSPNP